MNLKKQEKSDDNGNDNANTNPSNESEDNQQAAEVESSSAPNAPEDSDEPSVDFQSLLRMLRNNGAGENVSVPMVFLSVLHMATEQSLKLTGSDDLTNFTISQDKPPEEPK